MVVDTSPFSALMSGASPVTFTVVLVFVISSATFAVTEGPSGTVTARLSVRKPSCVTVSVYLPGARKKNWYMPSRSVFVSRFVPLALSLISTLASGTTALLGSVTTPVNPPEAVVCALKLLDKRDTSRRVGSRRITGHDFIETHLRFQAKGSLEHTNFDRAGNTTLFSSPKRF